MFQGIVQTIRLDGEFIFPQVSLPDTKWPVRKLYEGYRKFDLNREFVFLFIFDFLGEYFALFYV